MTVHRFFVEPGQMEGDRFPIPRAIEHQVTRVLRLRDGEKSCFSMGAGVEARCRLDAEGSLTVLDRGPAGGEPRHRLTICQALLKGDGLERVVQQGTELGVAAFRLFVSERCVVRQLSPSRLERLRAVARESAEQSERGACRPSRRRCRSGTYCEATPCCSSSGHADDEPRLGTLEPPGSVIIGPEGGFSPAEVEAAGRAGARIAGLGPRILRSESVAIAAAAVVLSRAGDFA